MQRNIDTSVIICTKDRAADLINLLDSLCIQTKKPDEVIIVDASKNDDTKNMLADRIPQLPFSIIFESTSPGLTKQRNIGIDCCDGKYIFFFDDDVILNKAFIEIVFDSFQRFEKSNVGGVMGKIANVSLPPRFDRWFKRLFFLSDVGGGRVKLSGLPSIKTDEELSWVESLPGGCTAYLREVVSQFRFDENLKGYGYLEDVDFSYRVGRKYRLLYQPKATLNHYPSTYLTADTRELRKMFIQHHTYLFHKNLPKDIPHYTGYWLSVIGTLLYNGILLKNLRACVGIIEGLLKPLTC